MSEQDVHNFSSSSSRTLTISFLYHFAKCPRRPTSHRLGFRSSPQSEFRQVKSHIYGFSKSRCSPAGLILSCSDGECPGWGPKRSCDRDIRSSGIWKDVLWVRLPSWILARIMTLTMAWDRSMQLATNALRAENRVVWVGQYHSTSEAIPFYCSIRAEC
jgi:hypothetical protein